MLNKTSHGFTVLSKKLVYKNPFMLVNRLEVKRPDGHIKPYWVLDRGTDFSIIIPIFPDNSTLLVGQYRVSTDYFSWEFPMGSVKGKNPDLTAKIELQEETGYSAGLWQHIGQYHVANGHTNQIAHIYVAKELKKGKAQPEENEFLEVKKMKLDEVKTLIENGKIKDGPTITAYFFLESYLKTK